MAIVKAKYIRGKDRIKAHLRYITHRKGLDVGRITRPLFGRDGALSKLQIYEMIDAARRGAFFHKFGIMPTLCGVMRFTTIEPLSKPPSKRFGFSFQHEEKL